MPAHRRQWGSTGRPGAHVQRSVRPSGSEVRSTGPRQRRAFRPANQLIKERAQAAARDERRIEVAERPGRRVPRIREQRLARVLALRVDALERFARQEDLAAHLDASSENDPRPHFQPQRDGSNRPQVRGDVLAARAVASRRASDEAAVLVGQRNADAVDLQLRDVGDVPPRVLPEPAADAVVERPQLFLRVRVIQAEHRLRVFDGLEAGGRAPAHAPCRGIVAREVRVLGFELLELAHERVELDVGDLRIVQDVVALFVMANETPKLVDSFGWRHMAI